MSIAMLSAISLICGDAALPAAALSSAAATQAAAAQPTKEAAPETPFAAAERDMPAAPGAASAAPGRDAGTADAAEIVAVPESVEDALVFADESDAAVVARLEAYLAALKTLSGDFTQVSPSGGVTTGKVYLRRPGLLRFEYDPPTPLLVVANGGLVYVRDEALETTDSYPVRTTPLKFLLQRKVDLEDARVVGVDRGVDNVAVTFASADSETEGELTVIVSAPEMALRRWIVRDIKNGVTVVALDNVKTGERLSNRLFETPDAGGIFLDN